MGPSSSHTIGPETACLGFIKDHPDLDGYKVILYGSLAKTGRGHLTDRVIAKTFGDVKGEVEFNAVKTDIPHPNTMDIIGYRGGEQVECRRVISVGGGAIKVKGKKFTEAAEVYPHKNFTEIAEFCKSENLRLYEYAIKFEGEHIVKYAQNVWRVMTAAIARGLNTDGILDGGLQVKRKASTLYNMNDAFEDDTTRENRLVCSFAFAVSEENAACGQIVTAPTCGSAGVLPAVLYYFKNKYRLSEEK